ncbi:MAG: FAD-binding protein [Rhodospirillaceae bacterium]|nr:FAD-binding protein [Rhodospirillaceae bacterium]
MDITPTDLSCDILIVGSGSAGAMAAIKAKLAGADVLVATKGPYPSGNSTKALAGYGAAFGHSDERDNPEVHFGDVVRNGIGLCNEKMVRTWTTTICDLTEEMRSWGLDLIRDDEQYNQRPWEGHTYPRMVHHHWSTGKYLMKCLSEKSKELELDVLSHTIIGGIFKDADTVSGAWGFNYRSGGLYIIHAKAVIMTTGGYGAMYPVGDNVGAATGEGYAIAFDASAEMLGMEFGHYLPTPVFPKALQVKFVFAGFINGLINEAGARLLNNKGEEFFFKIYPETGATKLTMEELTRRIGEEILKGGCGPHGGIIFDISEVDDEFKDHPKYGRMWELAERGKVDLLEDPIELICYPHDLVGGIKINEKGETNVPGFFAAGEATGGSHGASRFGGSALSDCLVFGALGALEAVNYVGKLSNHTEISPADIDAIRNKLSNWIAQEGGVDPAEILDIIRQIAGENLNIARSEAGIKNVFSEIADIESNLIANISAQGEDDKQTASKIRQAIEAEGQITLCRLLGTASLERTESRGGYFGGAYRLEHPNQDDDNWLKNIVLRRSNGGIKVSHDPIVKLDEEYSEAMLKAMSTEWAIPDDAEYYSTSE